MRGKFKKFAFYNLIALLVAIQLVILINYWYFVFQNISQASIRDTIAYQGKIVDNNSVAIPDGSYKLRFSIYDAATSGNLLWSESWDGTDQNSTLEGNQGSTVTLNQGIFTVELNSLCGSWVGECTSNGGVDFNSNSLYLLVELDRDGNGAYEETFLPRKRFSAVAYAMNADKVDGKGVGTSGNVIPLLDANNTWTGLNTIIPASAETKGFVIQGSVSQSANLQEWQDSTAAVLSSVDSSGNFNISNANPQLKLTSTGNSEYSRLTRTDSSNLLTLYNRVLVPGAPATPYALSFSGSNYVSLPDVADLKPTGAMTLAAWIKTTSGSLQQVVATDEPWGTGHGYSLLTGYSTSISFALGNAGAHIVNATTPVTDGSWHLVVATWDGTTQKIYVDGSGTAEDSATTSGPIVYGSTTPLIGADNLSGLAANFFNGSIDEALIKNTAISGADVTAMYNAGAGRYMNADGNTQGLYHFDDGTGSTAVDVSGNGNNGTLINSPSWVAGDKALGNEAGTITEESVLQSQDGVAAGEAGIITLGAAAGTSKLNGTVKIGTGLLNYLSVTGGATTVSPSLSADGETDLNLFIKPKGNGGIIIPSQSASAVPLIVMGADSQTGNLQEWRSLAGSPLLSVTSAGNLTMSSTTPEIRLVSSANSEYSRISRTDTSNKLTLFNRVGIPGGVAPTPYALTFNGSTDYVALPNVSSLKPTSAITVAFWYKSTDGNYTYLVSSGAPNADRWGYSLSYNYGIGLSWQIGVDSTTHSVNYGYPDNYPPGQTDVGNGSWHYIVGTYDGTTQKLYVDNSLAGSTTWTGSIAYHSSQPLIGAYDLGGIGGYFNGSIDEVMIKDAAIDATEVSALYNSGAGLYFTADAHTKGLYHFEEGAGSTATDSSGNGNNGTLAGTPTWSTGEKALQGAGSSVSEVAFLQSEDGVASGEAGILTLGTDGGTIKMISANTKFGADGLLSISSGGILTSTVPDGTAPFVITSTTEVANLNANLLQGHPASDFALAGSGGGGSPDGNSWALIYDNTVGSAVSDVTATGLDGDTDEVYKIQMYVVSAASGASFDIQPNGDSGANYWYQYILGAGSSVTAGQDTAYTRILGTFAAASGDAAQANVTLYAKSGSKRVADSLGDRGSGSNAQMMTANTGWNNTGDNITSLKFISNVSGAIGAGSRFMIWKKNGGL